MKVTCNHHKNEQSADFPKLMCTKQPRAMTIVLMIDDGEGVVVVPSGTHCCGEYSTDWAMGAFSDYHGTVTLEND